MEVRGIYTDYLISQNNYTTATGLSNMLGEAISHDQVSRFLRKNEFGSKAHWQWVKSCVREYQTDTDGVLLLNDSTEEKPYTDANEINCWDYSHAKSTVLKGINILSCMVRYGDSSLPVGYEIIRKEVTYCDFETK